ncbi:MAG: hydantoinase/oxoprolinase family protein [Solirubrobacteraceae bacterium]
MDTKQLSSLSADLYVGLDVGGTFTDLVVMDDAGHVWSNKVPTTPGRLEQGVQDALELFARERSATLPEVLERVRSFGHGTTQATNVVVQRSGARTALITTRGFGDTIFIARLQGFTAGVPDELLGFYSARRQPEPVVTRELVFEVPERVDQAGRVLLALDEDAARAAIERARDAGVEALAVVLLWSPRNPAHELRIAELAAELAPELPVSLSHEVAPVVGEYERTATTVLNSYVSPRVRTYLEHAEQRLRDQRLRGAFRVLSSAGGVMSAADAARRPVTLLGSGPAGGVIGSRQLARTLGHRNVITTDMGGTSFDVGLIIDGQAAIAAVNEAGGYHVATPAIEITAIGAGGGSIASVVQGTLRVGPASAGADPGPVCYARGGERPTVTDADVVLGILAPESFLGGRMSLDRHAAATAIETQIAQPLGLTVEQAAAGIRRVVDSQMAGALREITIGRGHDPRDFVLYAYGGAGPMHCATFGSELGVPAIVIPATAMVHCAYGALSSDVLFSAQASLPDGTISLDGDELRSSSLDDERLERAFAELERQASGVIEANGVAAGVVGLRRSADLRYRRQTNELIIEHPGSLAALVERFEQTYEDFYGRGAGYREAGIEITTLRVEATGATAKPQPTAVATAAEDDGAAAPQSRRIVDPATAEPLQAVVFQWAGLSPGEQVRGPAVIEHPTTTVYLARGQSAALDRLGNLELTIVAGP